ncbi:MAG: UDP-galactopyranose mutase [Rickettsiales bacterium]|nr:MAG: UDP-galactopyranose mutase [Rickettsiales bacterium]
MSNILIVGAGISGATIANKFANNGDNVLVVDKRGHIAGNCHDYVDKNGILTHTYGPHIFHTQNEDVWSFLTQFTIFNTYMHKVAAIIEGIPTFIPFSLKSLYQVFPHTLAERLEKKLLEKFQYNQKVPIMEFQKQDDEDLKFLAKYVYDNVFANYTAKQWGLKLDELDPSVGARVPVYISQDERYFQDKYQGMPIGGYTKMFEKMLDHKNIKVQLNTDFKDITGEFDKTIYTGSIDEYFSYKHSELPYRSVNFKQEDYDFEFYQQEAAVINYPNNYDFTRVEEHKHFYKYKSVEKTTIFKEYSEDFVNGKNERFYPIQNEKNQQIYNKYLDEAVKLKNVYFLGRLGDYKYYNMDMCVARALEKFEEIK